jgi:hypothetical protein
MSFENSFRPDNPEVRDRQGIDVDTENAAVDPMQDTEYFAKKRRGGSTGGKLSETQKETRSKVSEAVRDVLRNGGTRDEAKIAGIERARRLKKSREDLERAKEGLH